MSSWKPKRLLYHPWLYLTPTFVISCTWVGGHTRVFGLGFRMSEGNAPPPGSSWNYRTRLSRPIVGVKVGGVGKEPSSKA